MKTTAGSLSCLGISSAPTAGGAVCRRRSERTRSTWLTVSRPRPRDEMQRRSCRRSLRTTLLCELLGRSRHRFPPLSGRRAVPAVPSPAAYDQTGKVVLRPTPALSAPRSRADWFEPSPDSTRRLRAAHLSEARPPSHRETTNPTSFPSTAALDWSVRGASASWGETSSGHPTGTDIGSNVDSAVQRDRTPFSHQSFLCLCYY